MPSNPSSTWLDEFAQNASDGSVEVDPALLDELQRGDRDDGLCHRVDPGDRVRLPRRATVASPGTAGVNRTVRAVGHCVDPGGDALLDGLPEQTVELAYELGGGRRGGATSVTLGHP